MERRCNDGELWVTNNINPDDKNKKETTSPIAALPPLYWKHDVAPIDSRSDRISVLMGILSFLNGRWVLRDGNASVECVAVDGDCHQFRERCVFASKFNVHRECFTVGDPAEQQQRVYISIEEFHAASLPLAKPDVVDEISSSSTTESVRFLALNKSLPQMIYSSDTAIRHVFGYLIVASLHGQSTSLEADRCDRKRRKKDEHSDLMRQQQQQHQLQTTSQSTEGGSANCILLVSHDHPTLSYPALMEGRVYEIRLDRRKLLSNPYLFFRLI